MSAPRDVLFTFTRRDLRMLVVGGVLAGAIAVPLWLGAAAPSLTTFSNGTVADAAAINGNFQALATAVSADGMAFNEFYEEGTWTPSLVSSDTASSITYSTRKGWWVRMGDYVQVSMHIIATVGAGGTGYLRIGGLPMAPWNGDPAYRSSGAISYASGFVTAPIALGASGTASEIFVLDPNQNGNGSAWSTVSGRSINLQASILYRFR